MTSEDARLTEPFEIENRGLMPISRRGFFAGYMLLLIALLGGFIWNVFRPFMSPNDRSRWDTVWSLVEYGTYEIYPKPNLERRQQFDTIDMVMKDGKYYSSKPPALSTAIAGFVWLMKAVIGKPFWDFEEMASPTTPANPTAPPNANNPPGSAHIYAKSTIYLFHLAPLLLMVLLYRRFLDRYARTDFAWIIGLLTAGLGTFITGYVATLNNHVIGAAFAFFTSYLLVAIWYEGRGDWWRYALCGFCAGWTFSTELSAGLLAVAAAAICLLADWKKTLLFFAPLLAVVVAFELTTNHIALGTWKPAYFQKDLYDYEGSYWTSEKKSGIDGLNDNPEPWWLYFIHMTIGHHGLFSLTPMWIFAMYGIALNLAGRDGRLRQLSWPVVFVSLGVLIYVVFVNDQRNYGGFCHGMRWLIWLGPLWLLLLPSGLDALAENQNARRAVWVALFVSIFSMADTLYNPWTRSWLHRILLWWGVIDY